MDRSGFSIVMPTYNESSGIGPVLERLTAHVGELRSRYDVEVILVDDGSSDATVAILERFSTERPGTISIVRHERNAGLVAAMRTGARAARYDTVVFLDADLSYDPDIVEPLVLARARSEATVALASPYMRGGYVANVPFVRLIASRGANWILARCAGGRLATFTGMVRAYDRLAFLALFDQEQVGEFNTWAVAVLLGAGRDVVEVPASLVWPADRYATSSRLTAGKLWERVLLVIETAQMLTANIRRAKKEEKSGTLALS